MSLKHIYLKCLGSWLSVLCFNPTHIFGISIMFLLQCLILRRPRSGPCFDGVHGVVTLPMPGPSLGSPLPFCDWRTPADLSEFTPSAHLSLLCRPSPLRWSPRPLGCLRVPLCCMHPLPYMSIFLSSPQQRHPSICWVFSGIWPNSFYYQDEKKHLHGPVPSFPL